MGYNGDYGDVVVTDNGKHSGYDHRHKEEGKSIGGE